jgi:hypothetical protein
MKKMECCICMENAPNYNLKGCTHSICKSCAFTMSLDEKNQVSPFGDCIDIDIILYQLTCPLCRTIEPYPITMQYRNYLNQEYKEAYRIWLETELFKNHHGTMYYTSRRKQNVRFFPNEKDDLDHLMYRIAYGSRTTALYIDDHNLYNDPNYFIMVVPIHPAYFCPYKNLKPLNLKK